MSEQTLTPELLEIIAERFKVLGEPVRLRILNALRLEEELSVSELIEKTELGQANLSKHLGLLYSSGYVERRKEGAYVYYSLANEDVFVLCDIMCGRLEAESEARLKIVSRS